MTKTRRLRVGDRVQPLKLPSIAGGELDLESLRGRRYLLSFLRFASCPFCNLRIHRLVESFDRFAPGFTVVAVFDSPLDDLKRHAERHHAPFPILADEGGAAHLRFGIEHSLAKTMKGMFLRAPDLLQAMSRGFLPGRPQGSATAMPADLLIDERGIVQRALYGSDEGDHLDLEVVTAFSAGVERAAE
ncbi:MAG: redoxin domain-containing protein [Myxococcales bacterium]|jgi:peroxiredoxin